MEMWWEECDEKAYTEPNETKRRAKNKHEFE